MVNFDWSDVMRSIAETARPIAEKV
jgi:hypothetical protein